MKQKIIVTNLRIPEPMWMQIKATAAGFGMSFNEYIQYLVNDSTRKTFFGYKEGKAFPKKRRTLKKSGYDLLLELARMPYERKPMGASEDDKIIYGIED